MGFLRTNYESTGDYSPLPIGEYEVIISKVEVTTAKSGNNMLKLQLTVRDDVDQLGKKRKFFDNCVEQDNMMWKFQQVAKACQLPEGADFPTLADFAKAVQFKAVRIKNKHRKYNDETQDTVDRFLPSKLDGVNDNPFASSSSEDDLPF